MSARKIKLIVQYDGVNYRGWQIQPGQPTIQGHLSEAVSSLVGRKVTVHGASRTDAGVSALGQVALFEVVNCPIPTENFLRAINDRLPDDIAVVNVSEAPTKFDLIGAVKSKLYRYNIYTGLFRPVLDIRHCWHIPSAIDIEAMNTAAQYLVGTYDFKSFASAKDSRENTVRTIFRCEVGCSDVPGWYVHNLNNQDVDCRWLYIDVEGDGFLYNMVRNIVGSLVEVGLKRWPLEKIKEVLEARDRTAAGPIAPAQGLCLMWIKY